MEHVEIRKVESGYVLGYRDMLGKHSRTFADFDNLVSWLRNYFDVPKKEAS